MNTAQLTPETPLSQATMRTVKARGLDDSLRVIAGQIGKGKANALIHQATSAALTRRRGSGWAVPIGDERKELAAILAWVRSNVRYTRDPLFLDTFQSAERTVQLQRGDCDDMTILIGAMAENAGYPVAIRVVDTTGDWNHVYPLVGVPADNPKTWLALDATVTGGLGWEPPESGVRRVRTSGVRSGKLTPFLAGFGGLMDKDESGLWVAAGLVILLRLAGLV